MVFAWSDRFNDDDGVYYGSSSGSGSGVWMEMRVVFTATMTRNHVQIGSRTVIENEDLMYYSTLR